MGFETSTRSASLTGQSHMTEPTLNAPNRRSQRFGSQGFPAIPVSMNVQVRSCELLPFSVRKGFALSALLKNWAVIWGGAKRTGENVPENALSRKFLDSKRASGLLCRGFLYRKNRALTPPFWERCHSRGFPPPSFSSPPWRPLKFYQESPNGGSQMGA